MVQAGGETAVLLCSLRLQVRHQITHATKLGLQVTDLLGHRRVLTIDDLLAGGQLVTQFGRRNRDHRVERLLHGIAPLLPDGLERGIDHGLAFTHHQGSGGLLGPLGHDHAEQRPSDDEQKGGNKCGNQHGQHPKKGV